MIRFTAMQLSHLAGAVPGCAPDFLQMKQGGENRSSGSALGSLGCCSL